jgi:hypothetical protein
VAPASSRRAVLARWAIFEALAALASGPSSSMLSSCLAHVGNSWSDCRERRRTAAPRRQAGSANGRTRPMLPAACRIPRTREDIWALPRGGEPTLLLGTPSRETAPAFSADGRWLTYASDDSGRHEVYVVRYPELDRRTVVSTGGGREPVWSPQGGELFYLDERNWIVAVPMQPDRQLTGRHDEIQEYVIALEVFDRRESFDARADSIVRVRGSAPAKPTRRLLRRRGPQARIRIVLPERGYVPSFEARSHQRSWARRATRRKRSGRDACRTVCTALRARPLVTSRLRSRVSPSRRAGCRLPKISRSSCRTFQLRPGHGERNATNSAPFSIARSYSCSTKPAVSQSLNRIVKSASKLMRPGKPRRSRLRTSTIPSIVSRCANGVRW